MAVEKRGAKRSKARKANWKESAKDTKKTGAKKTGIKKIHLKKSAAKRKSHDAVKNVAARKPVPINKARVGERVLLPPLPPPTVLLKATRSPVRRASRVKALLRNKGAVKASPAVSAVAQCTESALREKLRLAAPYVELWVLRGDSEPSDAPSPEAAFVRIWQWLTLETMLEDRRPVNGDLIKALFAEEVGHL